MKKLSKEEIMNLQNIVDEEKHRNNYTFNTMVDEFGRFHVDCDLDSYVRELGLISMEEHIKILNRIQENYAKEQEEKEI